MNKETLENYYKIYEQIYEDPRISVSRINEEIDLSPNTISKYLRKMYALSVISGPTVCMKPSGNYKQYVSFLKFDHPLSAFKCFSEFPGVISRTLSCGSWDLILIPESLIDYSQLEGFEEQVHQGVRGVTVLSKVTSLDWEKSKERMYEASTHPKQKSSLHMEILSIPWQQEEWTLYHAFKDNVRVKIAPVLKKCGLRYDRYRAWFSKLPKYAEIQTAFYPRGLDNYFILDFLLESDYHRQLTEILGMLPSTSVFFSVGDCLFARLHVLTRKEKDDLLAMMHTLGEEGFFTNLECAYVDSSSARGSSGEVIA